MAASQVCGLIDLIRLPSGRTAESSNHGYAHTSIALTAAKLAAVGAWLCERLRPTGLSGDRSGDAWAGAGARGSGRRLDRMAGLAVPVGHDWADERKQ